MTHNATRPPRSRGNFHNPVGLVYRMLRSGQRPAYSALFREGLRMLATPFDLLLSPFESNRLAGIREDGYPLILVAGPPRSGTTLVYQVLAYCLDVT